MLEIEAGVLTGIGRGVSGSGAEIGLGEMEKVGEEEEEEEAEPPPLEGIVLRS